MNVIFLDIDGVMNSSDFYRRRHSTLSKKLYRIWIWIKYTPRWILTGSRSKTYSLAGYVTPASHLTFDYTFNRLKTETDPQKWEWLSDFCNRTDTKICISSCWRRHFSGDPDKNNEMWEKALVKLGFSPNTFVGITTTSCTLRGQEIMNFINTTALNDLAPSDVEKYAIIDDDADMLPEQMDSFFHVDGYYGLSPNTLYRIGRHFNKPIK